MSVSGGGIALLAVGDLAPTRPLVPAAPATAGVWERLRAADITTANLEIPLTNRDAPAEKAVTLRADPSIASSLGEVGLDVVTVANNHALDHGPEGLSGTLSALDTAAVGAVGGGSNLAEASRPSMLSVGETTVAVLGLACTLPTGFAAGPRRPGIAPVRARSRFLIDAVTIDEQPGMAPWVETRLVEEDLQQDRSWVAEAREAADVVVVHAHWGVPNGWCAAFQGPLADYQQPLGRALIDAGADLIVGHHPHALHGVEKYNGGVIAYSLGNFLFHDMSEDGELELSPGHPPYDVSSLEDGAARLAAVLELRWEAGRTRSVRFLPTVMNARGEPEFASGAEAEAALALIADQSGRLDTRVEIDAGVATLVLQKGNDG